MVRKSTLALGVVGTAAAAAVGWTLYGRHTTEQAPYTVVARVGDAELRRYPSATLVETTAPTRREAFGRLFRYIDGENSGPIHADEQVGDEDAPGVNTAGGDDGATGGSEMPTTAPVETGASIPMTAPVEVGRDLPMTAPVETESDGGGVRMAFYLPASYAEAAVPKPTDDDVRVVTRPERTLAVRRFRGRAKGPRVNQEGEELIEGLRTAGVPVGGRPFYMGYDAPWTLPPLRRNEVAVEVDA